ncbi:TPA: hypothetical protein SUB30_005620 [Bacillus pseudomycoides]|nr:hypothetical protein [Bacillus pseudomycoides]
MIRLFDYELEYLDDTMKKLARQGKFTEMDLDRHILMRLDMEEEPFDEDDALYQNQMEIHLNEKQFILGEVSLAELFFLIDQGKIYRIL